LISTYACNRIKPRLPHGNDERPQMSKSEQKLVQYLNEAHASETGLMNVLQ